MYDTEGLAHAPQHSSLTDIRADRYEFSPNIVLEVGARTESKEHTQKNQDAILLLPQRGLFGVFDGMGGHFAGEIASGLARDTALEVVATTQLPQSLDQATALVEKSLINASKAIDDYPEKQNMGTTGSVVMIWEAPDRTHKAVVGNVGDSRVYILRANQILDQITLDDSVMREMINNEAKERKIQARLNNAVNYKDLSSEEKKYAGRRHELSNSLGGLKREPQINIVDIQSEDRIIILSDGIHDNLTDSEIADILQQYPDNQTAVDELIKAAKKRSVEPNPKFDPNKKEDNFENKRYHFRAKSDDMSAIVLSLADTTSVPEKNVIAESPSEHFRNQQEVDLPPQIKNNEEFTRNEIISAFDNTYTLWERRVLSQLLPAYMAPIVDKWKNGIPLVPEEEAKLRSLDDETKKELSSFKEAAEFGPNVSTTLIVDGMLIFIQEEIQRVRDDFIQKKINLADAEVEIKWLRQKREILSTNIIKPFSEFFIPKKGTIHYQEIEKEAEKVAHDPLRDTGDTRKNFLRAASDLRKKQYLQIPNEAIFPPFSSSTPTEVLRQNLVPIIDDPQPLEPNYTAPNPADQSNPDIQTVPPSEPELNHRDFLSRFATYGWETNDQERQKILSSIRLETFLMSADADAAKRADYLARQLLHEEQAHPVREKGKTLKNLRHKASLFLFEEYHREKEKQRILEAMIANNNSFLTLDEVREGAAIDNRNWTLAEREKRAALEQMRNPQNRMYDLHSVKEGVVLTQYSPLKELLMHDIIRPLVYRLEHGYPVDEKIVQVPLAEFISRQRNSPDKEIRDVIENFFGKSITQTGQTAQYFATDLIDLSKEIFTYMKGPHQFALDELESQIQINFNKTNWAHETEVNLGKIEKVINWAKTHQAVLPLKATTLAAIASVATVLAKPALGIGSRMAFLVPGIGAAVGFGAGYIQKNMQLKRDIAMQRAEMEYGNLPQPDDKKRQEFMKFSYDIASVDQLLNGGGTELLSGNERQSFADLFDVLSIKMINKNTEEIPSARAAILKRIAEIEARLLVRLNDHVGTIDFQGNQIKVRELDLDIKMASMRTRLYHVLNIQDQNETAIRDEEFSYVEEWVQKLKADERQKQRSEKWFRIRKSGKQAGISSIMGLATGAILQEGIAGVERLGFHQEVNDTMLESVKNKLISLASGHAEVVTATAPSVSPEVIKDLYAHGGSVNLDEHLKLIVDTHTPVHTVSIVDNDGVQKAYGFVHDDGSVVGLRFGTGEIGSVDLTSSPIGQLQHELQSAGYITTMQTTTTVDSSILDKVKEVLPHTSSVEYTTANHMIVHVDGLGASSPNEMVAGKITLYPQNFPPVVGSIDGHGAIDFLQSANADRLSPIQFGELQKIIKDAGFTDVHFNSSGTNVLSAGFSTFQQPHTVYSLDIKAPENVVTPPASEALYLALPIIRRQALRPLVNRDETSPYTPQSASVPNAQPLNAADNGAARIIAPLPQPAIQTVAPLRQNQPQIIYDNTALPEYTSLVQNTGLRPSIPQQPVDIMPQLARADLTVSPPAPLEHQSPSQSEGFILLPGAGFSLPQEVNRILKSENQNDLRIQVSPNQLVNYLESTPIKDNKGKDVAKFKDIKISISPNQTLRLEGGAKGMGLKGAAGTSTFYLEIRVDPDGHLTVIDKQKNIAVAHKPFAGDLDTKLNNIHEELIRSIGSQISTEWIVRGFKITNGMIQLNLERKNPIITSSNTSTPATGNPNTTTTMPATQKPTVTAPVIQAPLSETLETAAFASIKAGQIYLFPAAQKEFRVLRILYNSVAPKSNVVELETSEGEKIEVFERVLLNGLSEGSWILKKNDSTVPPNNAPESGTEKPEAEVENLLEKGITALEERHPELAREYFSKLVQNDPYNEEAWMRLSDLVSNWSEKQKCLENVLVINPKNEKARRDLEYYLQKSGQKSQVIDAIKNNEQSLTNPDNQADAKFENTAEIPPGEDDKLSDQEIQKTIDAVKKQEENKILLFTENSSTPIIKNNPDKAKKAALDYLNSDEVETAESSGSLRRDEAVELFEDIVKWVAEGNELNRDSENGKFPENISTAIHEVAEENNSDNNLPSGLFINRVLNTLFRVFNSKYHFDLILDEKDLKNNLRVLLKAAESVRSILA